MKYIVTLITIAGALTGFAGGATNDIQSYRREYTKLTNQLLTQTNEVKRVDIRNKIEQLKQNNLHLFIKSTK